MADQMIHEMIAAFAVGCMDNENYTHFKDYLAQGGSLPEGELGELQNIVSMIPIILDLENPDSSIKDMVAKKLIGMKEEIKTKIIEEKKKTSATFIKSSSTPKTDAETVVKPKQNRLTFLNKKIPTPTFQSSKENAPATFASEELPEISTKEEFKTDLFKKKVSAEAPNRLTSIPPPQLTSEKNETENKFQPEKVSSGAAGWIAILLTLILFTGLGYFSYSSTDSLQKEIRDLKNDVTALKSDLGKVNDFIASYSFLIEFFNYKDITVVNLTSPDPNEKFSARVLFSFNEKEGLIQFKNVQPLPSNQAYQVWVVSKKQSYSIGAYQPKGGEYLKITSFPFMPKEQIEAIRVTIESKAGSSSASEKDYLVGTLTRQVVRGRVR
jgi:hypothetical protein